MTATAVFPLIALTSNPHKMTHRLTVAGGGPAGLSLAYFLRRLMPHHTIDLYEVSSRFGGWLYTERDAGGFMFERGCRGIRGQSAAGQTALQLASALGLSGQALPADSSASNRFILHQDRLVQAPKSLSDVAKWSLIPEKFSVASRALRPERAATDDESVRDFVIRHFGEDVADNVVDAVLSGVYAGDISRLSSRAVLGMLHKAEELGGGSIILGLARASRKGISLTNVQAVAPPLSSIFTSTAADNRLTAAKRSSSVNFVQGMQTLPEALVASLQADPMVNLHVGHGLESIDSLGTDGVFLACPARSAASILRNSSHAQSSEAAPQAAQRAVQSLDSIRYGGVATVCMGWQTAGASAVLRGKEGFGYLVPSKQRSSAPGVLGVVWDSCTFPQQAPSLPGAVRVSVMMGGALNPEVLADSDENLKRRAAAALETHLGHAPGSLPQADTSVVFKAAESIPQYEVGHVEKVHQARADVRCGFGDHVVLTGNSYNGVGIADTIQAAWDTAWQFAKRRI